MIDFEFSAFLNFWFCFVLGGRSLRSAYFAAMLLLTIARSLQSFCTMCQARLDFCVTLPKCLLILQITELVRVYPNRIAFPGLAVSNSSDNDGERTNPDPPKAK